MPPEENKGKFIRDTRRFKLDEIMKTSNFIPLFEGRPNRDAVIGSSDLIDLAIDLHKSQTVEEFIQRSW
jgi:hypothetical protein